MFFLFGKNAFSCTAFSEWIMHAVRVAADGGAFFVARLRLRHFFLLRGLSMDLYRELYYRLFAVISDAVESLENEEPIAAKKMLLSAMRYAEERVITAEEEK